MTQVATKNLLVSLHRWASRQDENFITEALAHLLSSLLANDEVAGIKLLYFLTGLHFPVQSCGTSIRVGTQVTTSKGRPDIEIIGRTQHVYVEAKVEAILGDQQLERYLAELDGLKSSHEKALVVLSRYPVDIPQIISSRVVARRWYQVAHQLVDFLDQGLVIDSVNKFLVQQMIDFLKAKNITMEKVGPEMLFGLQSFWSLMAMVSEAILAISPTAKPSFGREWAGNYIDVGEEKQLFFMGILYEQPNILLFQTEKFPVLADADTRLGFGRIIRASYAPNKRIWRHELVLNSDVDSFFDKTRDQQIRAISEFLLKSIDAIQRVRQEP